MLEGKVPVVTVRHEDESGNIYGTVTHNRARGQHLLEPMKAIIERLLNNGKTVHQISVHLGMKPEEVFRLSNFTREDFLKIMLKGDGYSNAEIVTQY
jgi:(2Fe-2S) ferredoxin